VFTLLHRLFSRGLPLLILVIVASSAVVRAGTARAQSASEVVLHSFDGTDGKGPTAGVIQGVDGNLYGTTEDGGANYPFANGAGTVFQLTPSGALTTLYSFCSLVDPGTGDCLDGYGPFAGPIQGSDGNFYGTTDSGGANAASANGSGTVFKLAVSDTPPSGTLTTLYSFCSQANCTDGENPDAVIRDSDGNFYGTTTGGGANGINDGTLFKLTPSTTPNDSTLTTLYSFCSLVDPRTGYCLDGEVPVAGMIQGSDGNFYGATNFGGAKDDGTVFKFTPSGKLSTLHSFCTKSDSRKVCLDGQNPVGVVQGSDGNFYGTTNLGGAKNDGTVFKLTPSGKMTTLYTFCRKAGCADGKVPGSSLIQGSDGNFYGTTEAGGATNYGTVFKLTSSGKLTTLYSFCSVGKPAANICLDGALPWAGLIQGNDGNLYGTTVFGGANGDGTVFEVYMPGHIQVAPTKLTLKAAPNATASASITIENTGTGPVTVDISEPKYEPPFSASGNGSSISIGAGDDYQLTITYSPTNSTTRREKSDSITVKAISNDPKQKKPIDVKLKGED
jgi:uncharacterized repeat protein (TIGR03803 family)